mgnify:CR=1 FL=1
MKKNDLNIKRLEILRNVKKNIIINGWNDNIFSIITKESKYNEEEVRALFSQGYKSLLELYLFNADQEMIKACNKIDLITLFIFANQAGFSSYLKIEYQHREVLWALVFLGKIFSVG